MSTLGRLRKHEQASKSISLKQSVPALHGGIENSHARKTPFDERIERKWDFKPAQAQEEGGRGGGEGGRGRGQKEDGKNGRKRSERTRKWRKNGGGEPPSFYTAPWPQ